MTGADVLKLQRYLNANGFTLTSVGFGAPGEETAYFGRLTYSAVVRLQEAHTAKILLPLGLSKGTGIFGPSTRAFIRQELKIK